MNAKSIRRYAPADLRWFLIALGITALQAGVVLLLSNHSPGSTIQHDAVPRVEVAAWDLTHVLPDPLLLALPTPRGFAGIGWRSASDPRYIAQDWTEGIPWLCQSETGLARTFLAAPTVGIGRGVTVDKPLPQLTQNGLPGMVLAQQTVLRIEGDGSDWELAAPLTLPSLTHSNVLSETVVQAIADASGQVFSAIVLKSSGLKTADQQALALARTAQFRITRVDSNELEWAWAHLIFEWRTLAPGPPAGEEPARNP